MTLRSSSRDIIERLKSIPWSRHPIHVAIVYGSVLRKNNPRDVDILVVPCRELSLDEEAEIMLDIERVTGLEADLHVVDLEDPNCILLQEALEHGKIVYVSGSDGAWSLAKLISLCYDYTLMKEKLRYTEKVIESVLREWESSIG